MGFQIFILFICCGLVCLVAWLSINEIVDDSQLTKSIKAFGTGLVELPSAGPERVTWLTEESDDLVKLDSLNSATEFSVDGVSNSLSVDPPTGSTERNLTSTNHLRKKSRYDGSSIESNVEGGFIPGGQVSNGMLDWSADWVFDRLNKTAFYDDFAICDWKRLDRSLDEKQWDNQFRILRNLSEKAPASCLEGLKNELALDLAAQQGICEFEIYEPPVLRFVTKERCSNLLNSRTSFESIDLLRLLEKIVHHPLHRVFLHADLAHLSSEEAANLLSSLPDNVCVVFKEPVVWGSSTILQAMWSVMHLLDKEPLKSNFPYSYLITLTSRDYPLVKIPSLHRLLVSLEGRSFFPTNCCMHKHVEMEYRWEVPSYPCHETKSRIDLKGYKRKRWPSPFLKKKMQHCLCNTMFSSIFSRKHVAEWFLQDTTVKKMMIYSRLVKMPEELVYGPLYYKFMRHGNEEDHVSLGECPRLFEFLILDFQVIRCNPAAQSHRQGLSREGGGRTRILTLSELEFVQEAMRGCSPFIRKLSSADSTFLADWIDAHVS